jgi:L-serine kinase (ADP)
MSDAVEFVLVPLADLRPHEEVDAAKVRRLAAEIEARGVFLEPVWIARGSNVILNGHHRVAALRRLGAERVPAWSVDYGSDLVSLDRWTAGPPISKEEVVRRAAEGRLFPPRTTRHHWRIALADRPTPLAELGVTARAPSPQSRRSAGARSAAGRSSPPG